MAVLSKARLYLDTVRHLKPSQVLYRVWRRAGGKTRLKVGYTPTPNVSRMDVGRVPALPELDFDLAFLARFDVDAILDDRVELLHHEEKVDWETCWHEELSTPLWRFNLHYFEYLLPLAKAYFDTGDARYLDKAKSILSCWMDSCPESKGGVAWDPYVISMRIVNWLAFYGEATEALGCDEGFVSRLNESLAEQYVHLSRHLEKDLLANHYLENLKALVILACYFDDGDTLGVALNKLCEQVDEQILPDGMHFELSPMYHKIVLEDLLRVAAALCARGCDSKPLVSRLRVQDMCDCLHSLEEGVDRTPLFNDSGDNVAKSRDALLACARERFGITPAFKSELPDAGYCILERDTDFGHVKLIADVGGPGPEYAMGHAHCDALSFECYVDGNPWVVNCGTYAYQDERRLAYKRTLSHSTVMVNGVEQHECWAPFRVARTGHARLVERSQRRLEGAFRAYRESAEVRRSVSLEADRLVIVDKTSAGADLAISFVFAHTCPDCLGDEAPVEYAPEFGRSVDASRVIVRRGDGISRVELPYRSIGEGGADA